MMKDKKSQLMIIGGIAIVAVIIIIILLSTSVFGKGQIDSLTPKKEGCNSPLIDLRIKGDANAEDTAFWGVQAEAESITVSEVRSVTTGESFLSALGNQPLRGFTSQTYSWQMDLINTRTANSEAKDKGSNTHEGGKIIQPNPYILDFSIPDNNCDGRIDDFDGRLKLTVTTDDNEVSSISRLLEFRNGRFNLK